ncbi:MAG TPA: type VI secretion system tip protein TssI/VgrG [Polyangiaceae bacterium]|jgi:type VI secretion system secreted protein VgrG
MDAQAEGPITIATSLDEDVTFVSMTGTEGISELFAYEIDVLCRKADLKPSDWWGASVRVQLARSDSPNDTREWDGVVTAFEYVGAGDDGYTRYRMTMRPWLWFLTQRADCRIFQNMTVPDIISQVFKGGGFTDFDFQLWETYPQRDYVVQYRETDFNFVSRLMERDGIYYFFGHDDGKHTLVLADSAETPQPAEGAEQLPYAPPDAHRDETLEYVTSWRTQGSVHPTRVALVDYDFTRPRMDLYTMRQVYGQDDTPTLDVYDYPGGYVDPSVGDTYAQIGLEQRRQDVTQFSGETNARAFAVGATFELIDHPRDDQNAKYLVTSARHHLVGHDVVSGKHVDGQPFTCAFQARLAAQTFRAPARARKAVVRGPQTARVVGPSGQEIWTDGFGRIKVQFHWDRAGVFDENSSCFVRVSHTWAGAGWGTQFIPRIGQEVIVDFLEGDPDRPIVVGCVYNGANAPPFPLPDKQTQSGIRTRSTPNGTPVNFNEIRFEDRKGHEELYIQAEKQQTTWVKGSQSIQVDGNRAWSVGVNEDHAVAKNRTTKIGGNEKLTVVDGDTNHDFHHNVTVRVGDTKRSTIENDYTVQSHNGQISLFRDTSQMTITEGKSVLVATEKAFALLDPSGDVNVSNSGNAKVQLANGGAIVIDAPGGQSVTLVRGSTKIVVTDDQVTIDSSGKVDVKGVTGIDISAGGSEVKVGPDGVTVTGALVKIN